MNDNDSAHLFEAYVMGHDNGFFFFMVIEKGLTAVLHEKNVERREKKIEVGAFYEVKIVSNDEARPQFRARHLVTLYRLINAPAPVRVDDKKFVYITTTAAFHSYVTHGSNRYAKFCNDTFGTFIDLYHNIDMNKMKKLVEFEFKCKSSPADKFKSVFVPVTVIRYVDEEDVPPVPGRIVSGLVVKESRQHLLVWSKQLKRDAILDYNFCPRNEDIIGRWVEIVVDDDDRVVEPVHIREDVYKTRVMNRAPEIFVTMKHDGLYESKDMEMHFHMFCHDELGYIADSEHMIPMPLNRGSYRAWIVRHNFKNLLSQWRISEKQNEPHLLEDSRNDGERLDFDQRSVSSHNGNRQHDQVSRSSSPGRRNFSSHNSQMGSRRNSRSPPRQPYQSEQNYRSEHSDGRRESDNLEPRTSMLYPNQRPLQKPNRSSGTLSVVDKSRDSGSEKAVSDTESLGAFGYSDEGDEEDVEPAKRREVPKTPSEDNFHTTGTNYGDERSSRASTANYDEPITPSYQARILNESQYGTPMASFLTPNREAETRPAGIRPIDTTDWKEKFNQCCELLNFYMNDLKVGREMELLDRDQYNEAKELIEFNRTN